MEEPLCPRCSQPLISGHCPHCADKVVFRIVQKELVLLVMLCVITIPLFLFTRSMAAKNRSMNVDIAGTWHRLGQEQLKSGNTGEAIESFRKAATNDHDNPEYALALATALAASDHTEEARQALLRLRMSAPEDGEVNLNLARLAAKEGMKSEAVRYYHNALYGVWPTDQIGNRRTTVRTELVRFLLSARDASQALSELLILSSDEPDNEQGHLDVGRLFLEAGDWQHALDHFSQALRLNPKSATASEGAGRASFDLGDYTKARRYLEAATANGDKSAATAALLETTRLVVSKDPLAPRLATAERIRRLIEDMDVSSNELRSCVNKGVSDRSSLAVLEPLFAEAESSMETSLTPSHLRADAEGFRIGLNLIYRIESAVDDICHESSPIHRALLLIAKKNGVAEQ